MFRVIWALAKFAVLALVILLLGNWVEVDGKTISDHVKSRISDAESTETFGDLKEWARDLTGDSAKRAEGEEERTPGHRTSPRPGHRVKIAREIDKIPQDQILAKERMELRAMLQKFQANRAN